MFIENKMISIKCPFRIVESRVGNRGDVLTPEESSHRPARPEGSTRHGTRLRGSRTPTGGGDRQTESPGGQGNRCTC